MPPDRRIVLVPDEWARPPAFSDAVQFPVQFHGAAGQLSWTRQYLLERYALLTRPPGPLLLVTGI